ncbi:hypothetical protein SAMN02745166_04626 [Prosthecobacter debontii]|uniref:Uncharacterized protein n=1 Tax=Prosthecobacter debontii TaxID=48467 RepID=A0A1T4YZR4_9BACT|nr:hypothetical protein [Prosthecobacter debontii]SKB07133.1 hypothetical protein SAMN02745166_04626 [Prosthecobacter debontii]
MTAFTALDRLFDPDRQCFTEDGARILADLRSDEETQARMEELASKSNEGTLNAEEAREYESWVRAGTLISILQAKARLYLKKTAAA